MFDTTKDDLKDLLKHVDSGTLQLPDFQRDYVWLDDDVRSLIASVAKGFPVGALLTLQTGGNVSFKPRLLAGVPVTDRVASDLLLDGQQRMTSLYQSTYSKLPVTTRTVQGKEVQRFYYVDIHKALASEVGLEDAIIGVPADRVLRANFGRDIRLDLSTQEQEFAANHFPLNQVFDNRGWFFGWRDYWKVRGKDVGDVERDIVQSVIDRIERYKMPLIRLDRDNSREAICLVFERVNVGGKKLDAFELVTAVYAADRFDLREDWFGTPGNRAAGRHARMFTMPARRDVLKEIASTDFLQACTLLHTREVRLAKAADGVVGKELPQVSCRRDALLALPVAAYRKYAGPVEAGFVEAAAFLNELKIIWHKDVPYPPQIVGLAAVFAISGKTARTAAVTSKLTRWFWSVVLGELYGSTTETRLARDVPELVDWIAGTGPQPRSMDEALFQRDRLFTLRNRLSAAYKGLHALVMRQGCRDFISGRPTDIMTFLNDKIDIHHIFPKAWCARQGNIPKSRFDSIVNKTPLSRLSNIAIGGDAPSVYLRRIEKKHDLSMMELDDILRSHLIEPSFLRADDFEGFFEARTKALAGLVSNAMGKVVVENHGANEDEVDPRPVTDEIDDDEADSESDE